MEKCDTCGRVDKDIGTCGSFLTCPKHGSPILPTDIILNCDLCGITRVVAAGRIMQGKSLDAIGICPVGDCQAFATVIAAEPVAKKAAPRGKTIDYDNA